ncbi:Arm DNA-binding domain-containing protein [Gilliamella sp. B2923]
MVSFGSYPEVSPQQARKQRYEVRELIKDGITLILLKQHCSRRLPKTA